MSNITSLFFNLKICYALWVAKITLFRTAVFKIQGRTAMIASLGCLFPWPHSERDKKMYSLVLENVREYPLSCKNSATNWFYILKFCGRKSNAGGIFASSWNCEHTCFARGETGLFFIWSQRQTNKPANNSPWWLQIHWPMQWVEEV